MLGNNIVVKTFSNLQLDAELFVIHGSSQLSAASSACQYLKFKDIYYNLKIIFSSVTSFHILVLFNPLKVSRTTKCFIQTKASYISCQFQKEFA